MLRVDSPGGSVTRLRPDPRRGEEGAGQGHAGRRQHGRRRGVGRLLHLDLGRQDRGRAGHDHGLDRRADRQGLDRQVAGHDRRRHRRGRRRQERADGFRRSRPTRRSNGRPERAGRRDLCRLQAEGRGGPQAAARQGAGDRARPRVVGQRREHARAGRQARRLLDGASTPPRGSPSSAPTTRSCSSASRARRASSRR